MADEKKTVTLLNRGLRHFVGVNAEGKAIRQAPGTTAVYTEEQVKSLGYADLVDISKLPGQVDTSKLKSENERLAAEKAALEAKVAALEAASGKVDNDALAETAGKKRK